MKLIAKRTINKFGKHYLLGINKEGKHIWLEEPYWNCGGYWSGGYLHEFTNDRCPELSRDLQMHVHFDSLFLNKNKSAYDLLDEYFDAMVITKDQRYELVDYMQTFYTLKSAAELFRHGYSWQTGRAKIDALKDEKQERLINNALLPEVFERITKLFE